MCLELYTFYVSNSLHLDGFVCGFPAILVLIWLYSTFAGFCKEPADFAVKTKENDCSEEARKGVSKNEH